MTHQCMEPSCTEEAEYYVHILVAPMGYPIERGMAMDLSITFCGKHIGGVKASDIFTPETKKMVSEVTRITQRSEVPLDFSRTRITPRKIGDKHWNMLTKKDDHNAD